MPPIATSPASRTLPARFTVKGDARRDGRFATEFVSHFGHIIDTFGNPSLPHDAVPLLPHVQVWQSVKFTTSRSLVLRDASGVHRG
jgi:hypothetical protein